MASLPQALYSSYANLGRQEWTVLTRPANTYGNSLPWISAATNGYGATAANQAASIPRTGQMPGYSALSEQGQQAIAAQGATVDLSDAVNASNLQAVGTVRANAAQRYADAMAILKPLADAGNAQAQTRMGDAYAEGHGVVRDLSAGARWYEKAALQGNTKAQVALDRTIAQLHGVEVVHVVPPCDLS